MKNFIIVDPFSTGALLAPEISKKGHTVYSVLSSGDEIPDLYKSSYTGEGFSNSSLMTIDEAKKSFKSIDNVIVGTESGVFAGDLLAEYFNVKGNSSNSSKLRRDKLLMQQTLKEHGLNYIRSYEINTDNYQSIINMLDINNGYVLKPKSSAGTDGVSYFKNKEDLLNFIHEDIWEKTDLFGNINNTYLVQEYISGQEFVVDMVINNDDIFVASLCTYEKCHVNNSRFVYKSLVVLDPNDNQFESLINYAMQCVKVLGIRHGPAHMELFYTSENKPVMIEVGARLHGGIAPLLFKECYDNSLLDSTVTYFIENTLPVNKKAKLNKHGKIVFLMNTNENSSLENIELFKSDLSKLKSFSGVKLFFRNNEVLPLTTDLTNIPGIIWLSHHDKKQIECDESVIHSLFHKYLLEHNKSV
ncbi:MAG: ATP-grasp domain-containing protein [Neisseriaceae bacterium]|nr:MAG: ATP-grasp domain-containing protein [Neisseriaceae bacterium]